MIWRYWFLVWMTACLPTGATPGDTLTEQEAAQLREVANLVANCQPVQGFPFTPCVTGDPIAAVPGLLVQIRVRRMNGTFICDHQEATGCWKRSTMTLSYDVSGKIHDPKGILDHELLHALLWAIDDWRHWCSLHNANMNDTWDCYE
jgi:hypothetical protein